MTEPAPVVDWAAEGTAFLIQLANPPAQIAFYAAPRTYGTVVDVAGFSQAGERIREAFAARDFDAMAAVVPTRWLTRCRPRAPRRRWRPG